MASLAVAGHGLAQPVANGGAAVFLPFSDEAPLVAAARADPTPAALAALAGNRKARALVLRDQAGDDTQGVAFQRFLLYAESAAKLAPSDPEAWKLYGAGLLMVPDWPMTGLLAEEAFAQALALSPGDIEAALGLGRALFVQQRFDPARTQWERTILAHPQALTDDLLGPLNMAYILSGELESGVDFYDRVGGRPASAPVALAQAILIRQLWRETGDPYWQSRLEALDARLGGPSMPAATRDYWRGLRAKWASEP